MCRFIFFFWLINTIGNNTLILNFANFNFSVVLLYFHSVLMFNNLKMRIRKILITTTIRRMYILNGCRLFNYIYFDGLLFSWRWKPYNYFYNIKKRPSHAGDFYNPKKISFIIDFVSIGQYFTSWQAKNMKIDSMKKKLVHLVNTGSIWAYIMHVSHAYPYTFKSNDEKLSTHTTNQSKTNTYMPRHTY